VARTCPELSRRGPRPRAPCSGQSKVSSQTSSEQFLYLTTRGRKTGASREIEIWFTQLGGNYYVIAEYPTSHWVENLRAHADVGVRVAGETFAARARILSPERDGELHRAIQELSRKKYGWGEGVVVELKTGT
jgi:deazaflavin-dependent oxidoreductase (nitroreductase family)